jgi:DNA-binding XRE family transcriptional regulator
MNPIKKWTSFFKRTTYDERVQPAERLQRQIDRQYGGSYNEGMENTMITCELHAAFCRNMRTRRLELGLTQAELARTTGVHQPEISDFEAGKREPTLATVSVIAKGLRIRPEALFLLEPALV